MKYKVRKEEWKKTLSDEFEVDIPEKPVHFWHNGERVAYRVVPVWSTWNVEHYNKPEEIFEVKVVKIPAGAFENRKIEAFSIRVSEFREILSGVRYKEYSRLIENLLLHPDEDTRTEEQFMEDYKSVVEKINEYLHI